MVTSPLVRSKFIDVKPLPPPWSKSEANAKILPQTVKNGKKLDEPELQQMVHCLMPTGPGGRDE